MLNTLFGMAPTFILDNVEPRHRQIGVQLAESFRHVQDNWHPQIDEMFGAITNDQQIIIHHPNQNLPYSIIPAAEIQRRLLSNVVGKINLTLQKEITHDVLDFIQKQNKSWEITNQLFTLAFYCCLDAIKDGVMLGLEGNDGWQLHVRKNGQIGIDLSFWKSEYNQYIINAYCCGTVLTWICIIPYNVVIENIHSNNSFI